MGIDVYSPLTIFRKLLEPMIWNYEWLYYFLIIKNPNLSTFWDFWFLQIKNVSKKIVLLYFVKRFFYKMFVFLWLMEKIGQTKILIVFTFCQFLTHFFFQEKFSKPRTIYYVSNKLTFEILNPGKELFRCNLTSKNIHCFFIKPEFLYP